MNKTQKSREGSAMPLAKIQLETLKQSIVDRPRERGRFIKSTIEGDFTGKSNFGWVPVDLIKIDPTYQRKVDKDRVHKMAANWNQDLVGSPVFSQREDGFYYVIDGQQRYSAFMQVHNHPSHMWGQVFTGLTQRDEAELFAKLDTERLGLTQGSKFKALLVANDPVAKEIAEIASECGLFIDYDKGPVVNNLRAIAALMDIHRRTGRDGLKRVLLITSNAWPNSKYSGQSAILLGLEQFFVRYPNANDAHLIEVLSKTTTGLIENQARDYSRRHSLSMGSLAKNVARVILEDYYNKKLRKNRLPEWGA